jgi:PAS domain S-box-containing protein
MTHPGDSELRELLFDGAADPILAVRPDGTILRTNLAAAEFLGKSPAELSGANFAIHVVGADEVLSRIAAMEAGETSRGDLHIRDASGIERIVNYSLAAPTAEVHILTLRDVADARRVEKALRASEALFARSFLGAPLALCVSNATTGNFVLVNEDFLTLTGYWRSDVIGRTAAALGLWVDTEVREKVGRRLADGEDAPGFRTRFRRKDGEEIEALGRARIVEVAGQRCVVTAAVPLVDEFASRL